MKKYVTGLVVGKFCPLHKGHEYLINTALSQCEKVVVLSYTSMDLPGYDAATRAKWLTYMDGEVERLDIRVINSSSLCLKDDAPEELHRFFCADYLLNEVGTTVQAVFTSESYGDGFAEYLTNYFAKELKTSSKVEHVMVDQARSKYPISGTSLRSYLETGVYSLPKKMMSGHVLNSFVRKILFLGGESTGKTTIVNAVADYFNTTPALEFGRFLYEKRKGNLQYEDMAYIGRSQLIVESNKAKWMQPEQYLFCDTSPLTTMFYSRMLFERVAAELTDLVYDCDGRYHRIYLCAPDFPMVQDGTRQDEAFRTAGHEFYLDELAGAGEKYTLLTGTLEQKIAKVIADLS